MWGHFYHHLPVKLTQLQRKRRSSCTVVRVCLYCLAQFTIFCMQRLFAWRMWTRAAIEPVCLLSRPLTQWASRVVAFIFVLICCAKMEGKKGPSISLIFHSCVNSVSWTHTHHQTNMDAHSWITWWIISLRWIHCVRNLSVQKLHFLDLFLTLQFLINNSF